MVGWVDLTKNMSTSEPTQIFDFSKLNPTKTRKKKKRTQPNIYGFSWVVQVGQVMKSYCDTSHPLRRSEVFFIKVWKPLPNKRSVLKTLRENPKRKAQSGTVLHIRTLQTLLNNEHLIVYVIQLRLQFFSMIQLY